MGLTREELILLLEVLAEKHGPGYAAGAVGRLQAKLSIMLQALGPA